MAEIVTIDKAGRIVIPKSIRESLKITDGSKFILVESDHGRLVLLKFDIDEIATNLENELKGKNIDAIVKNIRKEINEKIKKRYPSIFT